MQKSNLCGNSDANILVKATIKLMEGQTQQQSLGYERNKQVIFVNCALFTSCIR